MPECGLNAVINGCAQASASVKDVSPLARCGLGDNGEGGHEGWEERFIEVDLCDVQHPRFADVALDFSVEVVVEVRVVGRGVVVSPRGVPSPPIAQVEAMGGGA